MPNTVKKTTLMDRFKRSVEAFKGNPVGNLYFDIDVKRCDQCKYKNIPEMDFNKPIYTEIEGDVNAKKFRKYFVEHGIAFKESIEDYKYVGDLHVFECDTTDETLRAANRDTGGYFYQ